MFAFAALVGMLAAPDGLRFHFGPGDAPPGFAAVAPGDPFDAKLGRGFLRPGLFAVAVPEGNHAVTVRFGHPERTTRTTVKAESRRLMVENVEMPPGRFVERTFTVNVRRPGFAGGAVKLNARESGPPPAPSWDDLLTLEFLGERAGVVSVEVRPAPGTLTIFLAGDSTVTDQRHEPYAGWGQMLPRFFGPGVAVANHAESGLALFSFEGQRRLDKLLDAMRPGDYLFVQFGHNDQKDKRPGAGPFTTYLAGLKKYAAAARAKGGVPVFVTPMERRRFGPDGKPAPTLADYAEAVRRAGAEEGVPVIDLNAMSLTLYGALGEAGSARALCHYPAGTFPGQSKPLADNTHHNNFGGYELARCVVEGIRAKVPALVVQLATDAGAFDPAKPDAPDGFGVPASAAEGPAAKPAGE